MATKKKKNHGGREHEQNSYKTIGKIKKKNSWPTSDAFVIFSSPAAHAFLFFKKMIYFHLSKKRKKKCCVYIKKGRSFQSSALFEHPWC